MRGCPGGEGAGAIAGRQAGVGGGVPGGRFGEPEEDTEDGRCAGFRDLGTGGGGAEGAFLVRCFDSCGRSCCVVIGCGLMLLMLLTLLMLASVQALRCGHSSIFEFCPRGGCALAEVCAVFWLSLAQAAYLCFAGVSRGCYRSRVAGRRVEQDLRGPPSVALRPCLAQETAKASGPQAHHHPRVVAKTAKYA